MKEKNIGVILGFIAGEGSFTVHLDARNGSLYAYPRFKISVHERDRELLESINECVGLGSIYDRHSRDSIEWVIDTREESQKFAQQILQASENSLFVESDKYQQFINWLEFASDYEHPETREECRETIEKAKNITHADHGKSVQEWMDRLSFDQQS